MFHITSAVQGMESFTLGSSSVTTLHIVSTGLYNLDVSGASGVEWWNNSQNANLTNITYSAQTGALTFVAINDCNFSTAWLDQFAVDLLAWVEGDTNLEDGYFAGWTGMTATGTNALNTLSEDYGWTIESY